MLVPRRKKLYDIDPGAWEHPADTAALAALKQLKGIDDLIRAILSLTTEKSIRLLHVAASVKTSASQFPKVHALMDRIVDTFDWPARPEVFVTQSPFFNAGAFGFSEPFIVINSSLFRSLDDDELEAVLAHEMGHVMSGHALYKTLLWILLNIADGLLGIPKLILYPVIAALTEWDRKSELSADRAGLLALQNEDPNYRVLMKAAGGDDVSQLNLNAFFEQAAEYENSRGVLDSLFKILNLAWASHPFPVLRLSELRTWAASGQYQAILDGNYPKRGLKVEDAEADLRRGYDYYAKPGEGNEDHIVRAAKDIQEGLGKAAASLEEALKKLLG
ncbi:MAG TPA: M48 family metallopeptidase [Rectinemataceae bacterium]|nr:M48 family metallopeptidase [Rectinemataceae bacterium]